MKIRKLYGVTAVCLQPYADMKGGVWYFTEREALEILRDAKKFGPIPEPTGRFKFIGEHRPASATNFWKQDEFVVEKSDLLDILGPRVVRDKQKERP